MEGRDNQPHQPVDICHRLFNIFRRLFDVLANNLVARGVKLFAWASPTSHASSIVVAPCHIGGLGHEGGNSDAPIGEVLITHIPTKGIPNNTNSLVEVEFDQQAKGQGSSSTEASKDHEERKGTTNVPDHENHDLEMIPQEPITQDGEEEGSKKEVVVLVPPAPKKTVSFSAKDEVIQAPKKKKKWKRSKQKSKSAAIKEEPVKEPVSVLVAPNTPPTSVDEQSNVFIQNKKKNWVDPAQS